jgi:2-polyprenyl-3-methyl-5-hydroxy-6-metoxy-1,4-benzoquinol methylase
MNDEPNLHSQNTYTARRTRILAPRTGDVGHELAMELSEFLNLAEDDVRSRLESGTADFTHEWHARVPDASDERAVTRFYNDSTTEVFDLANWHATDPIHMRGVICADIASERPGRRYLDYGSGIGSDALIFAAAGFDVTLADVADPLLAFAKWRCERRGIAVRTIDLKREPPPREAFDVVVCFDVLEHVHRPLRTLDTISRSLSPGGLLFVHAPFGEDEQRPMHVVHEDVVTPRMHTVGLAWREDLERAFPSALWHPRVYQSFAVPAVDRIGYRLYESWLGQRVGPRLARAYRMLRPNRHAAA